MKIQLWTGLAVLGMMVLSPLALASRMEPPPLSLPTIMTYMLHC